MSRINEVKQLFHYSLSITERIGHLDQNRSFEGFFKDNLYMDAGKFRHWYADFNKVAVEKEFKEKIDGVITRQRSILLEEIQYLYDIFVFCRKEFEEHTKYIDAVNDISGEDFRVFEFLRDMACVDYFYEYQKASA